MAGTEETITVTIDGDALREKIQGILKDEMRILAGRFLNVAHILDPEGEELREKYMREHILAELKREEEAKS